MQRSFQNFQDFFQLNFCQEQHIDFSTQMEVKQNVYQFQIMQENQLAKEKPQLSVNNSDGNIIEMFCMVDEEKFDKLKRQRYFDSQVMKERLIQLNKQRRQSIIKPQTQNDPLTPSEVQQINVSPNLTKTSKSTRTAKEPPPQPSIKYKKDRVYGGIVANMPQSQTLHEQPYQQQSAQLGFQEGNVELYQQSSLSQQYHFSKGQVANTNQIIRDEADSTYQYFYNQAPQLKKNTYNVLNPFNEQLLKWVNMRKNGDAGPIPNFQDDPNIKVKKLRKPTARLNQRRLQQAIKLFVEYEKDRDNRLPMYKKITLARISKLLDLNHATVMKLYQDFKRDHTLMHRFMKIQKSKLPKQPERINNLRIQALHKILEENPFMTQTQMVHKLNQMQDLKQGGRQITPKNVWILLKKMKFSKKKIIKIPKFRNTPQNMQRRYEYCVQYKQLIDEKKKVYFLDQSAFSLGYGRTQAWSKVGEPILQKVRFPDGKSIALMAIMTQEGIVAWQVKSNNFQRQHTLKFLQKFFIMLSKDPQRQKYNRQFLIMDNCKIHDMEQSQMLADRYQINLQLKKLPPYSPQLNPIENWFNQVKAKVRKTTYETEEQLRREINSVISEYKNYSFKNYFRSTYEHTHRGIAREQF